MDFLFFTRTINAFLEFPAYFKSKRQKQWL